jgi:hypothetical protein
MKAYQFPDGRVWTGHSAEEAASGASDALGSHYLAAMARELSDVELDQVIPVTDSDGKPVGGEPLTIRSMLADMGLPTQ